MFVSFVIDNSDDAVSGRTSYTPSVKSPLIVPMKSVSTTATNSLADQPNGQKAMAVEDPRMGGRYQIRTVRKKKVVLLILVSRDLTSKRISMMSSLLVPKNPKRKSS